MRLDALRGAQLVVRIGGTAWSVGIKELEISSELWGVEGFSRACDRYVMTFPDTPSTLIRVRAGEPQRI